MHLVITYLLILVIAIVGNRVINRYQLKRAPLKKVASTKEIANLRELVRRGVAGNQAARKCLLDDGWSILIKYPIMPHTRRLHSTYLRLYDGAVADDFHVTNRERVAELVEISQMHEMPSDNIEVLTENVEALVALKAILSIHDAMSHDLRAVKIELAVSNRTTYTGVSTRLEQRAKRLIDLLWVAAHDDRDAFITLMQFMERTDVFEPQRMLAERPTIDSIAWNQLIARYFKNPAIELFCFRHRLNPGDLRKMAAEALIDNDFATAKLVLAYCNLEPKQTVVSVRVAPGLRNANQFCVPKLGFGYEVGSLAGELAKMIVRIERNTNVQYAS